MNFCIGRDVTIGVVNGRCALCENPRLAFFARPKTFVSVRCSNVSYRSYKEMNQKNNPDSETVNFIEKIETVICTYNFLKSSL